MRILRIGTRGSELALAQTRIVTSLLSAHHPDLRYEEVVIRTHGDTHPNQLFDIHWPAGGFSGAIEEALLHEDIDLAVHSYKDLPTALTPGLVVAAVPPRDVPHDVLVSAQDAQLDALPKGFRVGTSSLRRAAQLRCYCPGVETFPVRGNVPTRLGKLDSGELDAVVLAAAGLNRLGLTPSHAIALPVDRFVPAPAQGALAVQVRAGNEYERIVRGIEHADSRRAVEAERAFLRAIGAGCHTPAAALAKVSNGPILMTAQLFREQPPPVMATGSGDDPELLGQRMAKELQTQLQARP